jgi:4,5-dihydroxyphthalate decarboxylase
VKLVAAFPNRGLAGFAKKHAAAFFDDITFDFVNADGPGAEVMPRMISEQAFDVCDMSPTSMMIAAERGVPIAGLPVISYSGFPFEELVVREGAGIDSPSDLAGKTIGLRTWTNPFKVWLCGMLEAEYGVDFSGVRWITTVSDPIPDLPVPQNVTRVLGRSLVSLLASGEIDAAISPGPNGLPEVRHAFPDATSTAAHWLLNHPVVPVLHLPVIRRALVELYTASVASLVAGFTRAKAAYVAHLQSPTADEVVADSLATSDASLLKRLNVDPVPIGIDAIRGTFGHLATFMLAQGYLQNHRPVDEFFVTPSEAP